MLATKFQKEQHKLAINREHHLTGRKVPVSRKKYQLTSKRLKTLIEKLDNGILVGLQFIDTVAKVMIITVDVHG